MKTHVLTLAVAFSLLGCDPLESSDTAVRKDDFEGRLIQIADQATPASRVTLTLFHYSSGARSKRYLITTDCFDAGYFDDRLDRYVSGSAPDSPGREPLPLPHDRFCDAADLSRQRQLREWMFSGATITFHSDDRRAVIEAPTGEIATFAHKPSLP